MTLKTRTHSTLEFWRARLLEKNLNEHECHKLHLNCKGCKHRQRHYCRPAAKSLIVVVRIAVRVACAESVDVGATECSIKHQRRSQRHRRQSAHCERRASDHGKQRRRVAIVFLCCLWIRFLECLPPFDQRDVTASLPLLRRQQMIFASHESRMAVLAESLANGVLAGRCNAILLKLAFAHKDNSAFVSEVGTSLVDLLCITILS